MKKHFKKMIATQTIAIYKKFLAKNGDGRCKSENKNNQRHFLNFVKRLRIIIINKESNLIR